MKLYELTINTKEADALSEKVNSYLPNSAIQQQKNPFFLTLDFYAKPEEIRELDKKLKEDSLKYMILIKSLPKKRDLEPARRPRKTVNPKVELKEIEKKLEEILEEK